jgi:hypothetical protein
MPASAARSRKLNGRAAETSALSKSPVLSSDWMPRCGLASAEEWECSGESVTMGKKL